MRGAALTLTLRISGVFVVGDGEAHEGDGGVFGITVHRRIETRAPEHPHHLVVVGLRDCDEPDDADESGPRDECLQQQCGDAEPVESVVDGERDLCRRRRIGCGVRRGGCVGGIDWVGWVGCPVCSADPNDFPIPLGDDDDGPVVVNLQQPVEKRALQVRERREEAAAPRLPRERIEERDKSFSIRGFQAPDVHGRAVAQDGIALGNRPRARSGWLHVVSRSGIWNLRYRASARPGGRPRVERPHLGWRMSSVLTPARVVAEIFGNASKDLDI